MNAKRIFGLFKDSFAGWNLHEVSLHAAALAYYSILSLAPLLVISAAIGALAVNQAAAEAKIVAEVERTIGKEASTVIHDLVRDNFLLSLFINALWVAVPEKYLQGLLPNFESLALLFRFVASPVGLMLIFSVIFKMLPSARIRWRDVPPGATVTALLFWLGSYFIGLYLAHSVITRNTA